MQGIVTHYASDLHKIKDKLNGVRNLIENHQLHPLIKADILSDIDRCFALLKKGQSHDSKVGSKQGRSSNSGTRGRHRMVNTASGG